MLVVITKKANTMSRYRIVKKLPSCKIDVKTICDIEKYINHRLTKKIKESYHSNNDEDLDFFYSLSVTDKYGNEEFKSIEEYHRNQFPNKIKRLQIILYPRNGSKFDLSISLGTDLSYSEITLDIKSENAKEMAHGIIFEIDSLLKENATIHFLFWGKYAYIAWGIFTIGIGSIGFVMFSTWEIFLKIWLFLLLTSFTYWPLRLISPYTEFDTQKNHNVNSTIKWITNGLASVFVFGVLAYSIRNLLLKL